MSTSQTPPAVDPDSAMSRASGAMRAGDLVEALAGYDDALAQLHGVFDPERRGAALFGRGLVHQLAGSRENAFADVVAAFDAWRGGRPAWIAAAIAEIASACEEARPALAPAYWETAGQMALRGGDSRLQGVIAGHLGGLAIEDADVDEARRLWEEAERLARQTADDRTAAAALINLATLDLEAGRVSESARRVAEALSLAPRGPHDAAAARVLTDLAVAEAAGGRTDGALLYLEQALGFGDFPDADSRERVFAALAGDARDRGDLEEARRLGEETLELVRTRGDQTAVAQALCDLGVIALEGGWIDDAQSWFDEALPIARERRIDGLVSAVSRGLADVARAHGDELSALRLAEQAHTASDDPLDRLAAAVTMAAAADSAMRNHEPSIAATGYATAAAAYRDLGREDAAVVCEKALRGAQRAQLPR